MNASHDFLDTYLSRLSQLPDFDGLAVTPTTANRRGTTPLHIAAMRNECEAIVALALAGAALDACGERDWTPLHEAAAQGNVAAVGVLVALGASTGIADRHGDTACDVARRGGHAAVVECLRREAQRHAAPLDDIARQLEHAQTVPVAIARETILAWSAARDVERLGALCRLVQAPNVTIEPPLSFAQYAGIVLPYLRRCIEEDPRGEWAESREAAAATFRHWFAWLWRHRAVWPNELVELKHWLRGIVATADGATRACLVATVLEPLFDDPAIAHFFMDWRVLPDTAGAYADAFRWREALKLIGAA